MSIQTIFVGFYLQFTILSIVCVVSILCDSSCDLTSNQCNANIAPVNRFIFYDVNHYEGFNLRRDVYMRLAIFFNKLRRDGVDWTLILPPWSNLPHWRSVQAGNQDRLPWGLFFHLPSLQRYAPVLDMFELLEDHPNLVLNYVIILQHYEDIWTDNFTWTEKWDIEKCQRPINIIKGVDGFFRVFFSGHEILAKEVLCISYQGSASLLRKVLNAFPGRFIAFLHAEIIIHDFYGGPDFWKCRASMEFSKDLIRIAFEFRETLTSNIKEAKNNSSPVGYPYLCAHLRRRDYLFSHPKHVPSIKWAAKQVKENLEKTDLNVVFLATDASDEERKEFSTELIPFNVSVYTPPVDVLRQFKDGGVAIIEQIICSHAKFFIGTYESTFSFRIQEERELLNFPSDSTFNRLCGDNEVECKQPTRWRKTS